MARTGPKVKLDVPRYPGGQIKHAYREPKQESAEKVMSVALSQPHRRGLGKERASSQFAGYAYGRLFLTEAIDERQHLAAEIFTKRTLRYWRQNVGRLPFPAPTALSAMVKMDLELQKEQERDADQQATERWRLRDEVEIDEAERAAKVKADYQDIQEALADGGYHTLGNEILIRVCILDRDPINEDELGAFRSSLNLIARRLKL